MARTKRRQVCFRIEEALVKEMEQIREQTGVPVSTQVEMRLKGYSIKKSTERRSNAAEVWRWYQSLEKDEEFADNVEAAVQKMRELRLH